MTSTMTIAELRVHALSARRDYDEALRGFITAATVPGAVVTEFEAARILGLRGDRLGTALGLLDDAGDDAGFTAGYESYQALALVIDIDAVVEPYLDDEGCGDCDHLESGDCNCCACV